MTALTVAVPGVPAAQGSMRSLGPKRVVHSNADKLLPWREAIAWHTRQEMAAVGLSEPLEGPTAIQATFALPRPKSAVKARWAPDRKPDLDKLARSLLDSLVMAGALVDDAQVITLTVSKVYGLPGVTFTLCPAERGTAVAA